MSTTAINLNRPHAPRLGGFNLTYLGIEIKRRLANRRSLIFMMALPILLVIAVVAPNNDVPLEQGRSLADGGFSVAAWLTPSIAVYGAMFAGASAGAAVAADRALGWSRQLRLTPLSSVANVSTKVISGLVISLASVLATFGAAALAGVRMPLNVWFACGALAWLTSLVFVALGLMIGYLVRSENAMQFLGPVLALFAFLGGIFYPVDQLGDVMSTIAKFMPTYGIGEIVRWPVTGTLDWTSIANVIAWAVIFVGGATLAFRRDTKRV